jgi:hypothetical protein
MLFPDRLHGYAFSSPDKTEFQTSPYAPALRFRKNRSKPEKLRVFILEKSQFYLIGLTNMTGTAAGFHYSQRGIYEIIPDPDSSIMKSEERDLRRNFCLNLPFFRIKQQNVLGRKNNHRLLPKKKRCKYPNAGIHQDSPVSGNRTSRM